MFETRKITLDEDDIKKCLAKFAGVSEDDVMILVSEDRFYGEKSVYAEIESKSEPKDLKAFLEE